MSSNHHTPSPAPSRFTAIFASVLALTIASGGTAIAIANRPTVNEQQERILDSAITICGLGASTLIGLLNSHEFDEDEE